MCIGCLGVGLGSIHKRVAACKEAIKAGFKTQSQIIAEQGGDIHEVMAARKNEVELAEQLGLNFDVNMSGSPDNIATQGNIEESILNLIKKMKENKETT